MNYPNGMDESVPSTSKLHLYLSLLMFMVQLNLLLSGPSFLYLLYLPWTQLSPPTTALF